MTKQFRVHSCEGRWYIDYRIMGSDMWATTDPLRSAAECCRLIVMWAGRARRRHAAS